MKDKACRMSRQYPKSGQSSVSRSEDQAFLSWFPVCPSGISTLGPVPVLILGLAKATFIHVFVAANSEKGPINALPRKRPLSRTLIGRTPLFSALLQACPADFSASFAEFFRSPWSESLQNESSEAQSEKDQRNKEQVVEGRRWSNELYSNQDVVQSSLFRTLRRPSITEAKNRLPSNGGSGVCHSPRGAGQAMNRPKRTCELKRTLELEFIFVTDMTVLVAFSPRIEADSLEGVNDLLNIPEFLKKLEHVLLKGYSVICFIIEASL
ncbi:hypothetical protein WH47_10420 [Habropoda laboriosa]|uniref:Uncharacterized protein n=1 Tax=Habropoda laboriosa TaxID=597456 RepID=A0A0L7RF63_9HYME|nr:hypothetical protein WH47_10420 [Habropoda laboriosa]